MTLTRVRSKHGEYGRNWRPNDANSAVADTGDQQDVQDMFRSHAHAPTPQDRRVATLAGHLLPEIDDSEAMTSTQAGKTSGCPFLMGALPEDYEAYNTHNHHLLTALHEQHGDTFVLTRDDKPVVFVRSPASVREVLTDAEAFGKTWDADAASGQTQVDYVMNLIQPMLKRTIFNMHGDANFERRTALRPLFISPRYFLTLFGDVTNKVLEQWADGVVDIQDLSHDLLRKNILAVLVGEHWDSMLFCLEAFHEVMEYFVQRYKNACHDQTVTADDSEMMDRIMCASLRVVRKFHELQASMCEAPSEAHKRSMLALMAGKYSDEEMAATIVNVMIAAGEAPASALAQTIEEIARNGPVQSKLWEEVNDMDLVDRRSECTDPYKQLDYTEACCIEGLRLFAPATLVQRSAMEDTELDGMQIPKGTVVSVCVHSVHHDEKTWANAGTFDPERGDVLDIESSKGFCSFSKGPRGCPGRHVALAILKMNLAMIAQKFEITTVPGQPPSQDCAKVAKMVEWSTDGIPVQIRRR